MPKDTAGENDPPPPSQGALFDWHLVDERMMKRACAAVRSVCPVPQAEAADAVTDALIRLVTAAPVARDPQRLLNQAAVNIVRDRMKQRARRGLTIPIVDHEASSAADSASASSLVSNYPSPTEIRDEGDVERSVHEAMQQLPATDRALLQAVYFDRKQLVELDHEQGVLPGTHKARLKRARDRLRSQRSLDDLS